MVALFGMTLLISVYFGTTYGLSRLRGRFHKVQHDTLITILKQNDLDLCGIRNIRNIYWNQYEAVKTGGHLYEETEICRGVRQGCVLLPLRSNMHSVNI